MLNRQSKQGRNASSTKIVDTANIRKEKMRHFSSKLVARFFYPLWNYSSILRCICRDSKQPGEGDFNRIAQIKHYCRKTRKRQFGREHLKLRIYLDNGFLTFFVYIDPSLEKKKGVKIWKFRIWGRLTPFLFSWLPFKSSPLYI